MADNDSAAAFWRMEGITKHYGGVTALENVDFRCEPGQIHAVLGENGAGKSTLIKIIAGVVQPDSGRMMLAGSDVRFSSPSDANRHGIVCIFQELSLLPDLTVADNICITDPPKRFGMIDNREQCRRARELLARIGCEDVHPMEPVKNLPLSRRQLVEIAKALGRKPKLLILDEATSALTAADVGKVYALLRKLRQDGLAILYISHRMHEIAELADVCSVFRNGRHIETFPKGLHGEDEVQRTTQKEEECDGGHRYHLTLRVTLTRESLESQAPSIYLRRVRRSGALGLHIQSSSRGHETRTLCPSSY